MSSIVLQNDEARAEIALAGAELRRWTVGDVELIWTPDPSTWVDTAPILFPVVGWTKDAGVTIDGTRHALGLHGFARHHPFTVVEQWPTHARLALTPNAETAAVYPFDWQLEVEVEIDGPSLATRLHVANLGTRSMPYACGLHPGFCWPFAGGGQDEYAILFGERESGSVPVISPEGLFTRQTRKVPIDGRRLPLSPRLLQSEALCVLDARSRSLRFAHRAGAAIDIALQDFPHIALWSRAPGAFLSIEAWTGHGDHVDADGDLFTKPSMRHLAPGARATHAATYTFEPGHHPTIGLRRR